MERTLDQNIIVANGRDPGICGIRKALKAFAAGDSPLFLRLGHCGTGVGKFRVLREGGQGAQARS